MKCSSAVYIAVLCSTAEAFVDFAPRSGTQNKVGRGRTYPYSSCTQTSISPTAVPTQRPTSTSGTSTTRNGDRRQPIWAMGADDFHDQKLVLREFSVALEASPVAYERTVRAACLREGDEAATVVRWHISRADQETGQAHVE
ncbi:unnamed protein product, partial [Hapterophycus canaliculatus]